MQLKLRPQYRYIGHIAEYKKPLFINLPNAQKQNTVSNSQPINEKIKKQKMYGINFINFD